MPKSRQKSAPESSGGKQVPSLQEQQGALQEAVGMLQQGNAGKAETALKKILSANPENFLALNFLGIACRWQGSEEKQLEGLAHHEKAVEIEPDYFTGHNNLGVAYFELGRKKDARDSYRRAIAKDPSYAEAHNNLGNVLASMDQDDAAIASYRQALELIPDFSNAHNNLGVVFNKLRHHAEAIECFNRALSLNPDYAEAHNNLGIAQHSTRRFEDAIASFSRAAELKPDYAEPHINLAGMLHELGQYKNAEKTCRRAIEISPERADAHRTLGTIQDSRAQYQDAIASFRRTIELDPEDSTALGQMYALTRKICDWSDEDSLRSQLTQCVHNGRTIIPFTFLSLSDDPKDQLACARTYFDHATAPAYRALAHGAPDKDHPIRIAYLSADFHSHATAFLMAELFELHDRERFEIIGVSFGADEDSAIRRRLVAGFDRFEELRASSDRAIAERIAELKTHIVVDLKGYTQDMRHEILAYRPAPVQVNYLGYPGTMGAEFMDYIIADEFVLPPDQQDCYSEKVVHLPHSYQVNDSKRAIDKKTPSRAGEGLPEKGFVFCSFNRTYKITPVIFDIWMRLLDRVPDSVLWLFGDNELAMENLRKEAESRGVDGSRLVFAKSAENPQHLARHRLADLFLDTLPYNAHTTTSDALWAGLPVITCPGNSFASRVAGSLLNSAGLPELVTGSLEEYETLALKLATEPGTLKALGDRLKSVSETPLFDSKQFCRHIEAAYQIMFDTWKKGDQPDFISAEAIRTAAK